MVNETNHSIHDHHKEKGVNTSNIAGGVYGMAFIGAVIYYFSHAITFWAGVVGFFKALFWPAFLIYHLLEFLKM
jgi:hypothetical protein